MKSFFYFVEDYIVYEIILGSGCNVSGYVGIMIGYILIFLVFQVKRWINEQLRIDIYIDQIMMVIGVVNFFGFVFVVLFNVNIELGNDLIIGIEVYFGIVEIYVKMGYKVILGDENVLFKCMIL